MRKATGKAALPSVVITVRQVRPTPAQWSAWRRLWGLVLSLDADVRPQAAQGIGKVCGKQSRRAPGGSQ